MLKGKKDVYAWGAHTLNYTAALGVLVQREFGIRILVSGVSGGASHTTHKISSNP
jgi:hypothetical protein